MDASKLLTAVVARSLVGAHATVSTPQLRVLVLLHARGDLNLTAVAHRLGVNASNASRTCEQLVSVSLLSREDDPTDRRNVRLALTPAGRSLVNELLEQRRSVFTHIVAGMPPEARRELVAGLQAFLDSAAALSDATDLPDDEGGLLRWLL